MTLGRELRTMAKGGPTKKGSSCAMHLPDWSGPTGSAAVSPYCSPSTAVVATPLRQDASQPVPTPPPRS